MCDRVQPGGATSKLTQSRRRKLQRRSSRMRLPTPPPDPAISQEPLETLTTSASASQNEDRLLEYIDFLRHSNSSDALLAPVIATNDAFDHLDKLYKLMDQMLNLRQQNARLQRRIRDMEYLKNLYSLHRQFGSAQLSGDLPELDEDSFFAESLLDTMLEGSKKSAKFQQKWARPRLSNSIVKNRRHRSTSLNESLDAEEANYRRRSSVVKTEGKSSSAAKVSKWTKVKAAFRWEKASPSVSGAKSQDSGLGGMIPVNYEVVRYLRVPSTNEETAGISPGDSGAAEGSSPGSLSSASSADDLHRHHEYQKMSNDGIHYVKKIKNINTTELIQAKKNNKRMSACSDDLKLTDTQSDNEEFQKLEVFQENIPIESNIKKREDPVENIKKREVPVSVVERYQKVINEDEKTNSKQKQPNKKISKWIRVKKAFLTPSHVDYLRNKNSQAFKTSLSSSSFGKRDSQSGGEETKKVYEEIQSNYRQLQKRLSQEFKGKMQEWGKLRSNTLSDPAGTSTRSDSTSDDQKNQAFMRKMEEWQRIKAQPSRHRDSIQMINEGNLAPEFKKKLNEWEKMKKQAAKDDLTSAPKNKKKLGEWPKWKSVTGSGQKAEHSGEQNQPYSDDFLKKLEEWRKIKEISKREEAKEGPSTPKLPRNQIGEFSSIKSNKKYKRQHDKDCQWLDNELSKIENERRQLEVERQNFIQREERLAKLCKSVVNDGNKKDILIHTPTGYYKFEGISREFTRKLCEWEQFQGIKPEESTFALLCSSFTPHITVDLYDSETDHYTSNLPNANRLVRSKSAESVTVSNLSQTCLPTTHHPSSLSLNDVEELEEQCYSFSQNSSTQDIFSSAEKLQQSEPEAMIIEFEDIVEETASSLEPTEEKHFPIYQQENCFNVCKENHLVTPFVQTAIFRDSQYSFRIIDEIMTLLRTITVEEERQCRINMESSNLSVWQQREIENESEQFLECLNRIETEETNQLQKQRADKLFNNLIHLQEIYMTEILNKSENNKLSNAHFDHLSDTALDIFSDLFQMAEQLCSILQERCNRTSKSTFMGFIECRYSDVLANASELNSKLSEYKRILTYLYAASDMTAPRRNRKNSKKLKKVRLSTTDSDSEDIINQRDKNCEDAISKRLKFKKGNDCYSKIVENSKTIINSNCDLNSDTFEVVPVDPVFLKKIVIPTKSNYISTSNETLESDCKSPDIFVKTTRKYFAPSIQVDTTATDVTVQPINKRDCDELSNTQEFSTRLPPLPQSPKSQRKMSKEISPSIRMMLTKYNQLISEHEGSGSAKSAGSSGSASPVAWRSPASERRVKAQRERYLEVVKKNFEHIAKVKKSASTVSLTSEEKLSSLPESTKSSENSDQMKKTRGILRSTSASTIHITNQDNEPSQLKIALPSRETADQHLPINNSRYIKIQKAKQEFLNLPETPPVIEPSSAPVLTSDDKKHFQNRYSQISMGSESSCESSASACARILIKSASAGMINVDKDTFERIDSAYHQDGYVTLPRSIQKEKDRFLGGKQLLSNIASKFRKVRMKKNKEHKKMSTVSTLCRQSLVVDITSDNQTSSFSEKQTRSDSLTVPVDHRASSSEDTSPSSSRSGSWIRRSKIFKAL